jgi:hypothetical protein
MNIAKNNVGIASQQNNAASYLIYLVTGNEVFCSMLFQK